MIKKPSLTIGIPAYNEEANIRYLLKDLLVQDTTKFKLAAIIVSSDGSTDNTVTEAIKIRSSKIKVLENKTRKGRVHRQTQIMHKIESDILVLLDADTLIRDKKFIEKIISPIALGKADLTSVRVEELPAENFIEQVLDTSMKIKKNIFEKFNSGNNLYTCHGRARAFSKKLYKAIKFKDSINTENEDAYSYLFCISKDFQYKFVKNTKIFYKLPGNFTDHQKQSIRFLNSQEKLKKEFGEEFVRQNYKLPLSLTILCFLKYLFKKPLYLITYFLIFAFMKFSSISANAQNTWEISQSSKKLRKAAT